MKLAPLFIQRMLLECPPHPGGLRLWECGQVRWDSHSSPGPQFQVRDGAGDRKAGKDVRSILSRGGVWGAGLSWSWGEPGVLRKGGQGDGAEAGVMTSRR